MKMPKSPPKPRRHPKTGRFLSAADWAWMKREKKARTPAKTPARESEADRLSRVKGAKAERGARTLTKRGTVRAEYKGAAKVEKVSRVGKYTKRVTTYRVTPDSKGLARVADDILRTKGRAKVQVALGTSLAKSSRWAGTRLTDKRDASAWLQGVGKNYAGRFQGKGTTRRVVVEVLTLEKTEGKKWKSAAPTTLKRGTGRSRSRAAFSGGRRTRGAGTGTTTGRGGSRKR